MCCVHIYNIESLYLIGCTSRIASDLTEGKNIKQITLNYEAMDYQVMEISFTCVKNISY